MNILRENRFLSVSLRFERFRETGIFQAGAIVPAARSPVNSA
jgi:hypothetical protein